MSWIRLDDNFFRHPKAIRAGRDGRLLFIASLCYCSSSLTDGFVPRGMLTVFCAETGISRPNPVAKTLVEIGLWEQVPGGFRVHDYLDYNVSAEQINRERTQAKERMKKIRSSNVRPNKERTSENVRANIDRSSPEVRQLHNITLPNDTSEGDTPLSGSPLAADAAETEKPPIKAIWYSESFEEIWRSFPKHQAKKTAYDAWKRLAPNDQLRAEIMVAIERQKFGRQWAEGFVPDLHRWLRERRWEDEVELVSPSSKPSGHGRTSTNGTAPADYGTIGAQLDAYRSEQLGKGNLRVREKTS